MAMTREQFTKIVDALSKEGYGVNRLASFIEAKASAPVAKPAAPATGKTADGRDAYTCGVCHQPGHNARHHKGEKAATPAPAAKPAATPKAAAPVAPPVASVSLDDLSFDLGDLGGAPAVTPAAPKASTPKAPKASRPSCTWAAVSPAIPSLPEFPAVPVATSALRRKPCREKPSASAAGSSAMPRVPRLKCAHLLRSSWQRSSNPLVTVLGEPEQSFHRCSGETRCSGSTRSS